MNPETLKKYREIGKLPDTVTDANLHRLSIAIQYETVNYVLGGIVGELLGGGEQGTLKELLIAGFKAKMLEAFEKELASIKD